jgi:DNA-binding transcriptional LysR family regulator
LNLFDEKNSWEIPARIQDFGRESVPRSLRAGNAMNLSAVKLSQLRALVAVAKYGNFSEAAFELSVSQSAVSHAIATLEDCLGVILLARGRHGATVTPVGERVLHYAQTMLETLEAMGREANLAKGLQGGHLRLTAFRSVSTHVLPQVMIEFRKRFPNITVSLMEHRGDEGVEEALREGQADLGFFCMPVGEEFEAWELMRDEYVVLLPPHTGVPHTVIPWDELATYPLILPPEGDYCWMLIQRYLQRMNQPLVPAYQIREDSTIVNMVTQGLGASIMARLAAEPLPAEICVRQLPTPLERVIQAGVLRNALHSPAVYAFLDTLRDFSTSKSFATLVRSLSPGDRSTPLERSMPLG